VVSFAWKCGAVFLFTAQQQQQQQQMQANNQFQLRHLLQVSTSFAVVLFIFFCRLLGAGFSWLESVIREGWLSRICFAD